MQTKLVLVPDTDWVQKRGGGGGEKGGGGLEPRNPNIFAVTLGVKSLSLAGARKNADSGEMGPRNTNPFRSLSDLKPEA